MLPNAFATQSCLGPLGALDRWVGVPIAVWAEAGRWKQGKLQARSLRSRGGNEDVSHTRRFLPMCLLLGVPGSSPALLTAHPFMLRRTSTNEEWQDWESPLGLLSEPHPHPISQLLGSCRTPCMSWPCPFCCLCSQEQVWARAGAGASTGSKAS